MGGGRKQVAEGAGDCKNPGERCWQPGRGGGSRGGDGWVSRSGLKVEQQGL